VIIEIEKQIIETSKKAIVFSQWTSMLDLLEVPLRKSCIQYRRLDGTMSVLAQDKAVNDFQTLPEVTVLIMSLQVASLGLNMVAACHVLLPDLWWNPTTEDQAIDRAHRIGQMRPVIVSRFIVKDMVASTFGEDGAGGRQTCLTEEDLRYLFMV
jgi:SNF2 family DNA or RNA helicase